jgi:hypothetical protein
MSAEVERSRFEIVRMYVCTCTHLCYTHQGIRSFKLTLLAASVASEFDSDTTNLYVRKITDTRCKLKSNQLRTQEFFRGGGGGGGFQQIQLRTEDRENGDLGL